VASFTFRQIYPRYPLDRRLVGLQSQSGHSGKEKKSLPLPLPLSGIEPWLPTRSLVITLTEVPQLPITVSGQRNYTLANEALFKACGQPNAICSPLKSQEMMSLT